VPADLLAEHAAPIWALLHKYDALAARCDLSRAVLTHGEPHRANTMLTADGWRLVDWDTALVAPPERDLWHLGPVLDDYAEATGVMPQHDELELYRIRWTIADLAVDVGRFRSTHSGNADDEQSWKLLRELVVGL
jgi:spectinomycin phosphotransferase/16S rRNA (guanine(1405)-N(7))-methyltransferase